LIPALELWLQNPKFPGQDVSHFNKLEWQVQNNRKVYHVECNKRFALGVKRLAQLAKDFNIVEEWWGKHAHVLEVCDKDSTSSKVKRLCRVAQVHTNYQCSMIAEEIQGITDLNGWGPVKKRDTEGKETVGKWMLRNVLMKSLRLTSGHQLVAKVHQLPAPMSPVQAVVPHTPEAEQMILMMNKNFPVYISYALEDQELSKEFISELVKRSCCTTKAMEIELCSWGRETAVLTTPSNKKAASNEAEMVLAPWFKDVFAKLNLAKKGRGNLPPPPPEMLFNLAEERSIKTIHHRNESPPQESMDGQPGKGSKTVKLTGSEEESASLSSSVAVPPPAAATSIGDEESPNSLSDEEDDAVTQGAANGG
jgi:hypothetical protein